MNPVLTSNDRNAYTINLHPDVDTVGKSDLKIQVKPKKTGGRRNTHHLYSDSN